MEIVLPTGLHAKLPAEFCRRMDRLLGADAVSFYDGYSRPLSRGVRANTLKCSPDRLRALFAANLLPAPFSPDSFYLDLPDAAAFKAGADPLHHAGAYYMQEPSAASAVTVLAPRPGERVLDLCAAPGGKSTQIAAALQGEGLLWSNEYVRARARILIQNLERCGVRNAIVSSTDAATLCAGLAGFFDAVLVDAPCSGEGMFRKEPAALSQWSTELVLSCARRQAEILDAAASAVAPGGRLVYSTCTFAPEENECQIAHFLLRHPEFELAESGADFGRPGFPWEAVRSFSTEGADPGVPLEKCRRILPGDGGEGHFLALLRRRDSASAGSSVEFPGEWRMNRREIPVNRPLAFRPAPPSSAAERRQDNTPSRAKERRRKAKQGATRLNSRETMYTNSSDIFGLYKSCFQAPPRGQFCTAGEAVRLLPEGTPALEGLGVLAAGLRVADVCKNRLEPCHAAFLAARPEDCVSLLDLPLADPRVTAFLRGESIPAPDVQGWTAVAVEGVTVGFGKAGDGVLKNRYPKGLRLLGNG